MSAARTERLLNLLTLLLNARRPVSLRAMREMEEFAAYCGEDPKSGERAFERDKAALIELGVPLRWVAAEQDEDDDSGGGYVIDRERYYLPELALTPSELALLSIAGAAAATIEAFPGRAAVIRALAKLGFDSDESAPKTPIMAHAPLAPGVNAEQLGAHLEALHHAVAQHQRVHLTYLDARREKTEREVDPYGLYYRRGLWYLVGYCHLRRETRTFHLGRVAALTVTGRGHDFVTPAGFDLSEHAQRRPWEFPSEALIEVIIRVAPRLVPAIPEIFGPRAVIEPEAGEQGGGRAGVGSGGTDGPRLVRLFVSHRAALVSAVLGFGAATEVVSPSSLREEIRAIYTDLAARYVARPALAGKRTVSSAGDAAGAGLAAAQDDKAALRPSGRPKAKGRRPKKQEVH